jgi:hypothetical protein
MSLAFRAGKIPLRRILVRRLGRGILINGRRFAGEEALEETLCLPLGCMGEVDPNVHTTRATEGGIEALDVIGSRKEKAIRPPLVQV